MSDGAAMARRAGTPTDGIVFLGHATVLIELDGVRLLTDPLLRGGVAHLRRQIAPIDRGTTEGLDAVLISHMHHDHLDPSSLRMLGSDRLLLVPVGAGAWLRRRGFTRIVELGVGGVADVRGVTVTAVEARHDGRRAPRGPRVGALGYVASGARTVYFAGDTELFEGMSELPGPLDLALLPVGGWGATLGPGHMDPLQAARAAALMQPRVAVPVHWGTLLPIGVGWRRRAALGDPARKFAEHVARLAPSVEARVLAPGQATTL